MEYREQVGVSRKDDINHIARIITYVDIKKGKKPKLISLLTNDFDMPPETITAKFPFHDSFSLSMSGVL
jgi:hypothetical protein